MPGASDGELVQDPDELFVHWFVFAHGIDEGDIDDFIVPYTYHDISLSLQKGLDGTYADPAGQDAVAGRRRAAALQMSEYGYADVEVGILLIDAVRVIDGAAFGAFADNDDAAFLAFAYAALHELEIGRAHV